MVKEQVLRTRYDSKEPQSASVSADLSSESQFLEGQSIDARVLNTFVEEYKAEGAHRRSNEERLLKHLILMARLGLLTAFLITVLFLYTGFYLILNNHDVAGASICGAGLVSVVLAFLRHTSSQFTGKESKYGICLHSRP